MSPEIVRNALEHLMATKYNEPFSKLGLSYYGQGREEGLEEGREEGLEEGREEGLVAGERGTVLMVLKARGVHISDSQRARIETCDDLATLKQWAEAALTAATADDLFK
jgi:predicted transposase YdaD